MQLEYRELDSIFSRLFKSKKKRDKVITDLHLLYEGINPLTMQPTGCGPCPFPFPLESLPQSHAHESANEGVLGVLGKALDRYLDVFFFGFSRKIFFLFFILWWPILFIANYSEDPGGYQSTFLENKLVDALIFTALVAFATPPLMIAFGAALASLDRKSKRNSPQPQREEKSRGVFSGILNILLLPFKILLFPILLLVSMSMITSFESDEKTPSDFRGATEYHEWERRHGK